MKKFAFLIVLLVCAFASLTGGSFVLDGLGEAQAATPSAIQPASDTGGGGCVEYFTRYAVSGGTWIIHYGCTSDGRLYVVESYIIRGLLGAIKPANVNDNSGGCYWTHYDWVYTCLTYVCYPRERMRNTCTGEIAG